MLFLLALIAAPPPPAVTVLDLTQEADEESWLPSRLSDVLARRLSLLGVSVQERRFGRLGGDVVVSGRVQPGSADQEGDRITIGLRVRTASGIEEKTVRGRAGEIDRLASKLAVWVATTVGAPPTKAAQVLLEETATHPFAVHRFLGQAERRLEAREALRAVVAFDRAAAFGDRGAVPEAIEGRFRAEGAKVALRSGTFGSRADLAAAAAERASVALRHDRTKEAKEALLDVLKYTSERALRYRIAVPFKGARRALVVGRDKRWLLQVDTSPEGLLTIHPPTGTILDVGPGRAGLVGVASQHHLTLVDRVLSRVDPKAGLVWKVAVPLRPRPRGERVLFTEGSLGVLSNDGVAWVEVGLGGLGQVATRVKPLAHGAAGILVTTAKGKVALLRPGKKTPAWSAPNAGVVAAALTTDRAVLLKPKELVILRTYNGEVAKTLEAPQGGRLLSAHARYACVAEEKRTHVFDILAGEKTATIDGPGPPMDCYAGTGGVTVLYETGDLIFFDRDGRMQDRALVDGHPMHLVRGSPIAPGPVAVTDRGLFAFADLGDEPMLRDVEVMIRLAELEAKTGNTEAALRLANHVAHRSAGRIARAEMLRARLYRGMKGAAYQKAAAAAAARCRAAEHPTSALPRFAL